MRKQYVSALIGYFCSDFLHRLSRRDSDVITALTKHGGSIDSQGAKLIIQFEFMHLFNAVGYFAQESGIEAPASPDWTNQLKEFAHQLMQPWPMESFEEAGVEVALVKRSNSYARTKYQFTVN